VRDDDNPHGAIPTSAMPRDWSPLRLESSLQNKLFQLFVDDLNVTLKVKF
jgi:hypothetical protein